MTASKVAAVVGLSPWESRFSLWHRMAGLIPPEPDSTAKRRGLYLEPAIIAWWADQHPGMRVVNGGTWVHREDSRFAASPDRMVFTGTDEPLSCLEVKTSSGNDDWGAEGTSEIPPYYRAQVMWQMECTGARVCHVALLDAHLTFREYVVQYDPAEVTFLRAEAAAFMDSLPWGPKPQRPDLDAHGATYIAVRQLHPEIEDRDVELTADLARDYCSAQHQQRVARAEANRCTSLVADAMGTARRARYLGRTIATRQAKSPGAPYLVASRTLPVFTQESA